MSTDDSENGLKTLRPGQKNVLLRAGKGRPPGAKNRVPAGAKRTFIKAFEILGGAKALYRWANKARRTKNADGSFTITRPNLSTFYELAALLIPSEKNAKVTGAVVHAHAYIATPRATFKEQKQQDIDANDDRPL